MHTTIMHDKEGRPFTVRWLVPQDRRALEAMYEAFEPKRAAQGLPPHEHAIPRWLDRVLSSGEHLVVDVDGRLLGHVMLIPIGEGRVELANAVGVRPITSIARTRRTPRSQLRRGADCAI